MKINNVFCVIFVLIIIPFTFLSSHSPILSSSTEDSIITTQDKLYDSKGMASNLKTHLNHLQPSIHLCNSSEIVIEWNRTIGSLNDDQFVSVIETKDEGFVLAGTTYSNATGGDFWLVKIDANGNLQWNQTYGGPSDEHATVAIQLNDGGYVLAGRIGLFQAWVMKTDPFGTLLWSRTFGAIDQEDIFLTSGIPTTDGGFIYE